MYYKEIQKFTTDVAKIANNLHESKENIQAIKEYLFFNDSFSPDCAIAQSWQRLMLGKDIKQHDYTLINHELYEMKLKKDNPKMGHLAAHTLASNRYDYQKEVEEYYAEFRKRKKKR